jgi:hypothetical protein
MAFARGDVVLLRRAGGQRHAERAALIYSVSSEDTWFFLISGVRSLERSQRHRSEIDVPDTEAGWLGLPMRFPVIYCDRQHKLPRALPSVEPIGRASIALQQVVYRTWAREIVTRQTENRLTFRSLQPAFHTIHMPA